MSIWPNESADRVFELIDNERRRQEECINLIASENYASPAVMGVTGSLLTNKYAEGYPGRRYYGGCDVVDQIENYAKDQGKKLFKAEHINVQPHSGSTANMCVYLSALEPGDTVLGMNIAAGGHLTHGHKVNFSGKIYNFVPYGVSPEDEHIDYNEIEVLANQHKPKLIVAGASAYSKFIDFKRLEEIARNNHALLLIDMAHIAGLVAAGVHPSPFGYADFVSSTTHKTLRGPRGGLIFSKADHAEKLDRAVMPGSQGGPLMHSIAAKAVAFNEALTPEFVSYQKQVVANSKAMAQAFAGLGYRIVSGGTDNHLFLVDLRPKNQGSVTDKITGQVVEETLGKCGIVLNRNMIPFDPESPFVTSGMRIGTPAVTTRGFKEQDVIQVAHWIDEAIAKRNDDAFLSKLKNEIKTFCQQFPIYEKVLQSTRYSQLGA